MSKKKEASIEVESDDTVIEPNLDKVAFSIVKTGDKSYSVFSVDFNTEGMSSNVKIVATDIDLYEAQYQFKQAVLNAGLFN